MDCIHFEAISILEELSLIGAGMLVIELSKFILNSNRKCVIHESSVDQCRAQPSELRLR